MRSLTTKLQRLRLTKVGLQVAIITTVMFIPAYLLSVSLIFLIGSMLVALLLLNFVLVLRSVSRIDATLLLSQDLFAGDSAQVQLKLRLKSGRLPLHHVTLQSHCENMQANTLSVELISPKTELSLPLSILPNSRGHAWFRAITFTTAYPFGLFEAEQTTTIGQKLLIFPKLLEAGSGLFAAKESQGLVPQNTDDFHYLAAYQPGEDVRRIHWRKSAILDTPVIKKDLMRHEIVTPRIFVPDPCPHFEYAISALATHFTIHPPTGGWFILTEQGLVEAKSRSNILALLALAQPISSVPEDISQSSASVVFASQITPVPLP